METVLSVIFNFPLSTVSETSSSGYVELTGKMSAFAIPPSFQNLCPEHAGGPPGFLLAQLIQTLIAAHCAFNNPKDYPKDYGDELKDDEEFDFVIVGAGW